MQFPKYLVLHGISLGHDHDVFRCSRRRRRRADLRRRGRRRAGPCPFFAVPRLWASRGGLWGPAAAWVPDPISPAWRDLG